MGHILKPLEGKSYVQAICQNKRLGYLDFTGYRMRAVHVICTNHCLNGAFSNKSTDGRTAKSDFINAGSFPDITSSNINRIARFYFRSSEP